MRERKRDEKLLRKHGVNQKKNGPNNASLNEYNQNIILNVFILFECYQ
jgi:hypothetical protein